MSAPIVVFPNRGEASYRHRRRGLAQERGRRPWRRAALWPDSGLRFYARALARC